MSANSKSPQLNFSQTGQGRKQRRGVSCQIAPISQFEPMSSRKRYRVPLAITNLFKNSFIPSVIYSLNSTKWNLSHTHWHEQFFLLGTVNLSMCVFYKLLVCFSCLVSRGQISPLVHNKDIFYSEEHNGQKPVRNISYGRVTRRLIADISPGSTTGMKFEEDSNLESWGKKNSLFHLPAGHHMWYLLKKKIVLAFEQILNI